MLGSDLASGIMRDLILVFFYYFLVLAGGVHRSHFDATAEGFSIVLVLRSDVECGCWSKRNTLSIVTCFRSYLWFCPLDCAEVLLMPS